MIYQPRNDFVLFKMVDTGSVRGILVPERSAQGKERIIVAVGPKVDGLKVGDKVLAIGTAGMDLIALPNDKDLFLTREQNVVLVVKED